MRMMPPSMIGEQAATLPELYAQELPDILRREEYLPQGIRRVYAVGNGDSHHAALAAAQAFAQWTGIEYLPMPAYAFAAHEIARLDPARAEETLVVCISASGSSKLALEIFEAVKGKAHTLAMTGKPGCAMERAAEYALSVAILEKGRSPGIRTYAASLTGLIKLACVLGCGNASALADEMVSNAARLPVALEASLAMAERCAAWDWPLCSIAGSDCLQACAHFTAAKFAEGCGVFALSEDLEEWCHVVSMTYPLEAPVILLQGAENEKQQAIKVADVAHRAGHKVIMVCTGAREESLQAAADEVIFLDIAGQNAMNALYHYIPLLYLTEKLANKFGRAMFLSDQPFSLF